jgi:predicted aconitase with swiveling domain
MAEDPRVLAPGTASGRLVVLDEPLSLWGGMDPVTGDLVDPHHPQLGARLAGAIVAMPAGRGSSSSSSVLAEAIRAGVAPAGFLLAEPDPIVAIGSLVAAELYGAAIPVVVVGPETYRALRSGDRVEVASRTDGRASVTAIA